ncbi:MAG TPA: hypothetical protein VFB69_01435 [Candidatus Dormibacteraeota bacterium]|nr:hypothetical protein [Candidatus Dormibacteraeota bacterium]
MGTRMLAVVIVAVVIVYHVLRVMASQCSGGGCDWYIPFSLVLPLAAIALALVTGALAAYAERDRPARTIAIAACTLLAFAGSIAGAFVLSDNDAKVWVATVFVLLVPAAVLLTSARQPTRIRS